MCTPNVDAPLPRGSLCLAVCSGSQESTWGLVLHLLGVCSWEISGLPTVLTLGLYLYMSL